MKRTHFALNRKKRTFSPLFAVLFALLVVYVLVLMIPVIWSILISLVDVADYYDYLKNPLVLPNHLVFDNYINGIRDFNMAPPGYLPENFAEIIFQTLVYTFSCSLAATIVPCVMAYLAARYDFRFSKVIYGIVVVTMAIPIIGNMPSEITIAKLVGTFDNLWLFWIMKANFLGIYFLLFHAMFKQIPRSYSEAARIDGAGNFTIMLRVMFPLVLGTFGIVFLLNFITFWNDYQIPYYYLQSYPVVGSALFIFQLDPERVNGVPQLIAMIFTVAIPIILIAIIFNKKLMSNLSDGGIKE